MLISEQRARSIAVPYIAPDAPALTCLATCRTHVPDHLMSRLSHEVRQCQDLPGLTASDLRELAKLLRWATFECAARGLED